MVVVAHVSPCINPTLCMCIRKYLPLKAWKGKKDAARGTVL